MSFEDHQHLLLSQEEEGSTEGALHGYLGPRMTGGPDDWIAFAGGAETKLRRGDAANTCVRVGYRLEIAIPGGHITRRPETHGAKVTKTETRRGGFVRNRVDCVRPGMVGYGWWMLKYSEHECAGE